MEFKKTPHINAEKDEISDIVIMPGDPLRAKMIAETYLSNYKLVSQVRNIFAYTGYYKDRKITVMASGMGIPSMGIYSYELFKFWDVKTIIRVGSFGSYVSHLNVFDVLLVDKSYSDSSYAKIQNGFNGNLISGSSEVNDAIKKAALEANIPLQFGNVNTSDVFYRENEDYQELVEEHKCLGVEMEAFALFHNAKVLGKQAAAVLTCSDSFITKEVTSSEEREKKLKDMIVVALESSLSL